jgi:hypothetical protein
VHPSGKHFHTRLKLYNDGPSTADNVQVRLQSIEPRPPGSEFRGEFPYPVPDHIGERGACSIGERDEHVYQLARS